MVTTYREMRKAVRDEHLTIREMIRCRGGLRVNCIRPNGRPTTFKIKPEGMVAD